MNTKILPVFLITFLLVLIAILGVCLEYENV